MERNRKTLMRSICFILVINMLFLNSMFSPVSIFATNGCVIDKVYTDKAMYAPGGDVIITVAIRNPGSSDVSTALNVNIFKLEASVWTNSTSVAVAAGSTVNQNVTWTSAATDYTGYLVRVDLGDGVYKTTAVDVSSSFTRYPRYGYTTDFPSGETAAQSNALIDELAQDYHINVVQYYDWMWRHEKNFPSDTATSWEDLFGNTISKASIQQRIDEGHNKNQKAMAYQMSYMAREGYEDYGVSKTWGVYKNRYYNTKYNSSDESTINNIDQLIYPIEISPNPIIFAMNPQNINWQNHIINQYKEAVNKLSFDGIQVDQLGSFWGDIGMYDYWGNYLDLGKTFSSLINKAKTELTTNNSAKNYLTMNMVNGAVPPNDPFSSWDVVKNANTDFQFSEMWGNSNTYNSLKNYIEWQRKNDSGKTMVIAAYMNQNDNAGTLYEAENGTQSGLTQGVDGNTTYLTGFDVEGDYVSFNVDAPENGTYTLVFRATNGNYARATKNVYIDGAQKMTAKFDATRPGLIPPSSPSWTSWSTEAAFTTQKVFYLTSGTHTIKIQHDTGSTGDIRLDSVTLGTFNEASVRLTNAVIAASGAMHIEMGTGFDQANGSAAYSDAVMLGHPYYPKAYKMMRNSLKNAMKAHYNFITAYENLLYDTDLKYGDGGVQNISITGESVTGSGEAGKIFFVPRNKGDTYGILHLINLTSETDTDWRNTTADPALKSNLAVKYYIPYNKTISDVYWASPDTNECLTQSLNFTTGTDATGKYVSFTVPSLKFWDMIYFKYGTEAEPLIYEAEDSIKYNVTTNTNHAGYTGSGFVDGYGDLNDSVTFDIKIPSDGYYTLKFRYANGNTSECSRELIVDNASVGKTTFLKTANWDTWGIAEKGVYLKAGRHRLVLLVTATYGGFINLDNLTVEPLEETARSLYINNWKDTAYIWKDTEVNRAQALNGSGPGIYEMRFYAGGASNNYNTNNLKNYSMFLRNETDAIKYTDGSKFRSTGYFGSDGVLYNDYKTYNGSTLSPEITRAFAVVPNQKFMVVKYTVKNTSGASKTYKILDMLHVNNTTTNNISASYDSANKTATINMTAASQYYIAHGTLESAIDGYQVANDAVSDVNDVVCSPWVTFDNNGTVKNNSSITCADISTAFMKDVTLNAGASTDIYFYAAIAGTSADLSDAVTAVRGQTGSYWMNQMNTNYTDWLNAGTRINFSDSTLNTAYDRSLILIKQSIVPGQYVDDGGKTVYKFAAMPATTNPSAYSYKVWARDSAVTAMSLDASGHTTEAEKYWYWLQDRQITTDQGTWKKPGVFWTCYGIWDNVEISFVEPEYDSVGMFLVGAYKHYLKLSGSAQTTFRDNIWTAYKRSADFVKDNINNGGFGPADCSIWEEDQEYNAFTQALYVAGLEAAYYMAIAKGDTASANNYSGSASTMRSAVNRNYADALNTFVGLWKDADSNQNFRYFNRATKTDGTSRNDAKAVDSSSNVLVIYGVIDMMSRRGYSHYNKIKTALTHDEYGIPRYAGDTFYTGVNSWDPGGSEALENEPSWPQMTMWMAMMEMSSGYDSLKANAYRRLKWYVDRTNKGYMPQGEAVSNVTLKPCISTAVEPITGASYVMTALAYLGNFDMKILPNEPNAGSTNTITVNSGCWNTSNQYDYAADWEQWKWVPYFQDKTGDSTAGGSTRDIAKVYVTNDANNIYVRLDNVGKSLPGYNVTNDKFYIGVYSKDFADGNATPATSAGIYNGLLGYGMRYMVGRWSDSPDFVRYTANGTDWTFTENITGVIAPQWETNSGRIEMVIPKSALCSTGTFDTEKWARMAIVIGSYTGTSWSDADVININYRATPSGTKWLFGNPEEN